MTRLVYLARPVDLDGDQGYAEWIADRVTDAMIGSDLLAYNPAEAFLIPRGTRPNGDVAMVNSSILGQCRGMIVLFPERPSIGTGLELQMAQERALPTLVITTLETVSRSWSLAGLKGAHLVTVPADSSGWSLAFADQLVRAIEWLKLQARAVDRLATYGPQRHMKVTLDNDDCSMMTRPYWGDAGFDLYTSEDTYVAPDAFVDVPCGVSVQLPEGYWGMIVGRSSTLRKHRLLVMPGVIDNGYRGPLFAGVKNLDNSVFVVKRGMRLAQMIPMPVCADQMVQIRVDTLDSSDRGESGFGSSGE